MSYVRGTVVDSVVVKEERERLLKHHLMMTKGVNAADALLWFSEYAHEGKAGGIDGIIKVRADLIASSTPNASSAQAYINAVINTHAEVILQAAINLAAHDFHSAERIRKSKAPKP